MKFLKAILWLMLLGSFLWIFLFFAGPFLLKWTVAYYSNSQITLAEVKLSPGLNVNIGKAEFNFASNNQGPSTRGLIRSIQLEWSLHDKPLLKISTGPLTVNNNFSSDGLEMATPNFIDLYINRKEFRLNGKIENFTGTHLSSTTTFKFKSADFSALLDTKKSIFSDIRYNLEEPRFLSLQSYNIKRLSGVLDKFDLLQPLNHQNLGFSMSLLNVSLNGSLAKIPDLSLNLTTSRSAISFGMSADRITHNDGFFNSVYANSKFDNLGKTLSGTIELGLEDLHFFSGDIKLRDLVANIDVINPENLSGSISGEVDNYKLQFENYYYGTLPKTRFESEAEILSFGKSRRVEVETKFKMATVPEISGVSNLDLEIDKNEKFLNCLTADCRLSDLTSALEVKSESEEITFSSECVQKPCVLNSLAHEVITSNTNKIFEIIIGANFLNPFIVSYLYTLMLSGKIKGNGHIVNF